MDSQVCLTCLGKSSKNHNINKLILDNLRIIDLIRQLVPMLLEKYGFTLPDIICAKCLKELLISFKFQRKCLKSLQNFDNIVRKNSLITKVTGNIEYNSFDESSQPEDVKITIDEFSIKPTTIAANNNVVGTCDRTNNKTQENNEQVEKKFNEKHCNEKRSNNLTEKEPASRIDQKLSIASMQCKICSRYFKQPQGLASHMSKTHLKKFNYHCQRCKKGFDVEEPFIRHCNRHLGIKPFPCSQCAKSFETVSRLNKHNLCHSKERTYTCKICDKKFHRMDVFKQHTRGHENHKILQCLKCDKAFERFSDHKKHLETHGNENIPEDAKIENSLPLPTFLHQTENCELDKTNSNFENHTKYTDNDTHKVFEDTTKGEVEKVEQPDEYKMTQIKTEERYDDEVMFELEKEFNAKRKKQEIRFENEEQENNSTPLQTGSAQCDLCKQFFKNSQGLAIHRSSTHFKNYVYQCDQCDRGFSVEEFYIKHRNHHLGIKTFKCNQCDKVFETNSILNQHLISHSELCPYLCTVCGKGYRRIDSLRQHMKRHGDERPFKCSACPKAFKCLSDKLKHIHTHTKKRFECHVCGTCLSSSESLAQHKMIHTGEKPQKCKHCDKSFISLSNLKCHERIHTGEKPYQCKYCLKTFCQSSDRNKHIKRMHKSEVDAAKSGKKEESC